MESHIRIEKSGMPCSSNKVMMISILVMVLPGTVGTLTFLPYSYGAGYELACGSVAIEYTAAVADCEAHSTNILKPDIIDGITSELESFIASNCDGHQAFYIEKVGSECKQILQIMPGYTMLESVPDCGTYLYYLCLRIPGTTTSTSSTTMTTTLSTTTTTSPTTTTTSPTTTTTTPTTTTTTPTITTTTPTTTTTTPITTTTTPTTTTTTPTTSTTTPTTSTTIPTTTTTTPTTTTTTPTTTTTAHTTTTTNPTTTRTAPTTATTTPSTATTTPTITNTLTTTATTPITTTTDPTTTINNSATTTTTYTSTTTPTTITTNPTVTTTTSPATVTETTQTTIIPITSTAANITLLSTAIPTPEQTTSTNLPSEATFASAVPTEQSTSTTSAITTAFTTMTTTKSTITTAKSSDVNISPLTTLSHVISNQLTESPLSLDVDILLNKNGMLNTGTCTQPGVRQDICESLGCRYDLTSQQCYFIWDESRMSEFQMNDVPSLRRSSCYSKVKTQPLMFEGASKLIAAHNNVKLMSCHKACMIRDCGSVYFNQQRDMCLVFSGLQPLWILADDWWFYN